MKLNVGCGRFHLPGWVNIDADPRVEPERVLTVPPLPYNDGVIDEIYAGHCLEHLTPPEAREFLNECFRVLKPGGRCGMLVPDTREILRRYLAGAIDAVEYPAGHWWPVADLDAVCAMFLYSTVQDSRHQWAYDETTLRRAMEGTGFVNLAPIHRYCDPRIPQGAWYQVGWDGFKPEAA